MKAVKYYPDQIPVYIIASCKSVYNTVGTGIICFECNIDVVIVKKNLELGPL